MDGVLERIDEDEDVEASDDDDNQKEGKRSSAKKADEYPGKSSTGNSKSEPFDLGPQKPVYPVDLGAEDDEEEKKNAENNDGNRANKVNAGDDDLEEPDEEDPEATSGTLEMHIVEAALERNLDFGKQDPFAIFEVAG